MENIKNTIKKIVGQLENNNEGKTIVEIWNNVVDLSTLKKTEVENEKYGTLIVRVEDSATMYTLNMKKHKIIEQINEQMKTKKITNIRFKIKP